MFKDKRTAMVGTLVLALFLLSLTLTNPGKALAVSAFLKVDGIKGESTDGKHKEEIDVISWSFGETQSGTMHTAGGGGAGKVNMKDFMITMRTNKASPKLFGACAEGKHIPQVWLYVHRSGGNKVKFLEINLSEVIVSSFVSMGSSVPGTVDAYPMEEILLNFSKIAITYTQIDAKGQAGEYIKSSYDVKKNQVQ